jgi:DNA-binding transcriptional MerR regulator
MACTGGAESGLHPPTAPKTPIFKEILRKMTKNTLVGVSSKSDNGIMTIAEVAEKYGFTTDTLRYYERIGLIPPVTRNKSGIRDFTENDYLWVGFIKRMRTAGVPIEALIEYVGLFQLGESTRQTRKQILIEQREQLAARIAEMQETLNNMDNKIANYDTAVFEYEKKLSS